jgi:hypothetical protein
MPSVAAPVFSHRDVELPGSWVVEDRNGDVALLMHDGRQRPPSRELHVMDLRTGRTRLVVAKALTPGLEVLGYALGEHWVAWEETSPQDLDMDPRQVVWKVFAAPVDPVTFAAGKPRLIDSGVVAGRSRPQLSFSGDRLFWMNDESPSSEAASGSAHGVVRRMDLPSGASRVALERPRPMVGMRASDGDVVTTSRRRTGIPAMRIEVSAVASGGVLLAYDPPLPGTVAHVPAFHDGVLLWQSFPPGAEHTDVYLRSRDGSSSLLAVQGGDGALVGDFAFAEASESDTESVASHSFAPASQIYGTRIGSGGRFLLQHGLIEKGQWWQIAAPAKYSDHWLVVYSDRTSFGAGRTTTVRVYDVRSDGKAGTRKAG